MHRFRKKSETKHSSQASYALQSPTTGAHDSLPQLALSDDFRTSPILPDLSRRFSLLRLSSGNSITLDDLRSRFAEQRARGAENQISEEEEDMLLETLGRMRIRNIASAERSQENVAEGNGPSIRQSVQSTSTVGSSQVPSSPTPSPGGRSTKRYSNNLFGSGKFRDYTYMRSVVTSQTKSGGNRTLSLTPTESSVSLRGNTLSVAESLRPVTPESSIVSSSVQSSPNEKSSIWSAPLVATAPYGDQPLSIAEYRISKSLGPSGLKRASLALEEVIKEMEEEADDHILMPRSAPVPRTSLDQQPRPSEPVRDSDVSQTSVIQAGMAISVDKQVHGKLDERRASPIPSRILPGYIPGMPRPMTPRDFDPDDQRSHSTTPRATSPIVASFVDTTVSSVPNLIASNLLRRDSTSSPSRQSPRPISPPSVAPLFLQRTTSGRYTPEDNNRDNNSTEFESSLLVRRRPSSPLAGPLFQPMAVSSRPGTPSNVTWTTKPSGHSRNGSWVSDGGVSSSDIHGSIDRHKTGPPSLRSPALPDSPMIDRGYMNTSSSGLTPNSSNGSTVPTERPPSSMSGVELGPPVLSPVRATRSLTPTQNSPRSPSSPTFSGFTQKQGSRRSSRQNALSSPFNLGPFVLSPLANSSRSSLESEGSSYHSWDDEKDRFHGIFNDVDPQQRAWHDITASDKSGSATPGGSPDDDWDPDEIISRYTGLRKSDFLAIQEKLVTVASSKTSTDRAPSVRRRRPSTSQSNYSVNGRDRIASPPPPASPTTATSPNSDPYSKKASALLNSVVDSIQYTQEKSLVSNTTTAQPVPPSIESTIPPVLTRDQPPALKTAGISPVSSKNRDVSPSTRRNRDLAQVLFGLQDEERKEKSSKLDPDPQGSPSDGLKSPPFNSDPGYSTSAEIHHPISSPASPYQLSRNPSTPKIPQSPREEAELAREVRQKTEAAMLALKKSPVGADSPEQFSRSGSLSRKRITPHQISTPKFVSSTTSVDTIPLPQASIPLAHNPGPSRIGSRFKKLRGSLRAKNTVPNGEEVASPHASPRPPRPIQTAIHDPAKLRVPAGSGPASATDPGRFKVPVPSPPASAGPGLKGFMARLRGKPRVADPPAESGTRSSPQLTQSPRFPTSSQSGTAWTQKIPATTEAESGLSPRPSQRDPPRSAPPPPNSRETTSPTDPHESDALKQLFDAASNLGLDQGALNDLLARSASTSSRSTNWTMITRNNSTAVSARPEAHDEKPGDRSRLTPPGRSSLDDQSLRAESPDPKPSHNQVNGTGAELQVPHSEFVSRKSPSSRQPDHIRRPRNGQTELRASSAVIRRTLIFPSESRLPPNDLNALMRKNSSRRRRASATSFSSRSVHDRAPTPPPPRSPTAKHFLNEPSPPVPQLPPSLSLQAEHVPLTSAGSPIEKLGSAYDSLYDMYAGESRATGSGVNGVGIPDSLNAQGDFSSPLELRPALEVIELANGETIWSIVNGLRDDDEESVYTGRASTTSDYSTREGNGEGLQIFVKEHGRSGSKDSNSSFLSRKRPQQGKRPETKVFYSPSAQIGRLIENLSQGMDAGSFNFLPNRPGHSASSSLSTNNPHWTMEERLEHMLGSIGTSQTS